MKLLRSQFSGKYWLINNKGERITKKYGLIKEYYYGPYYLIECRDYYGYRQRPKLTLVYSLKTEELLKDFDNVAGHCQVNENIFAIYNGTWHIYDKYGNLIRSDVESYYECDERNIYIATINDKEYFLDANFNIISDGFLSISDFDEFGYALVQNATTEEFMFIDEEMNIVVKYDTSDIEPISKEYFCITKNESYGVIDIMGREILPAVYQSVEQRQNHFIIKYNDKFGLTDATGKVIFECFYDEILETPDKFAVKDFARLETNKTLEVSK